MLSKRVNMQGHRRLTFAGLIIAALLTACATTTPLSPNAQYSTAQAERLMRERQFANAAHLYEDLAQHAVADARDPLLLRAAHAWLRAEDLPRGENLLRQVGEHLPASDATLSRLATAEAALLNKRPERALAELDRIPQPYARDVAADVLELRARAQFAYGRPTGGVTTALDRERLLNDATEIERNRKIIWDGIQRNAAAGVDMQAPAGASRLVAGWLELGGAAVAMARNPYAAQKSIDEWRAKYPDHVANEFLTQIVLPQMRAEILYPSDIALILPLSGRFQSDGLAVRDGFVAALLQQPVEQRPTLRIYDSASDAVAAYGKAVTDGARFIVGPLTRPEVSAIASQTQITTPTLALNYTLDEQTHGAQFFQFAIDPTDEARQVAARVVAENHLHGIALLPNNEWGQRLYKAFDEELRARGGSVVANRFYDPAAIDFSKPVADALLITESKTRADALQQILGAKLQFEPRVRADIEFAFFAAREPQKARLLRPALRFSLPAEMPVYATSDSFEPAATANTELDGVVFPDMPWMISSDEVSTQLRTTLQKYWPTRARERSRLYAFGYDAYRLIPRLQAGNNNANIATTGMTGRLALDSGGRVRRDLDWARIVGGQPQALTALVPPSATPVTDKP
jgi:outer membrane PBP1 activator LpoA protein